jgi:mannitol-1-/sugar-/sorbitol-6-phosphatase
MESGEPVKITKRYKAFLFDMDGTVINSIAAAERVWGEWAKAHGLDVEAFLPTIHGARSIDTVSNLNLPGIDPVAEAKAVTEGEIVTVEGIVEIPGAAAFVKSLPADKWAIVTSAPRALAIARLNAAGMPLPEVVITAEDVVHGKPSPEGYILAARKLSVDVTDCLVFEDAEVGIRAAEAVGADVMVITTTHAHPKTFGHASIADYAALNVSLSADGYIVLEREGLSLPTS